MASREIIAIELPVELGQALRDAVASGEFPSVDEAAADALAAWSRRHQDREEDLAWVKARIKASLADPRPSLSVSEVRAHMKGVAARSRADSDEAA